MLKKPYFQAVTLVENIRSTTFPLLPYLLNNKGIRWKKLWGF